MPKGDPAAERAVLAAVFEFGHEAYLDVSDLVTADTFTIDSNAAVYRCLEHIFEKDPRARPDMMSVVSAAETLGLRDLVEQKEELRHLRAIQYAGPTVKVGNARRLAAKLRKLEVATLLGRQLEEARQTLEGVSGEEPLAHILGLAENPIFDLTSLLSGGESKGVVPMGEGALDYVRHLMDNPREAVGVSTGFPVYDEHLGGGLRPGGMDLIGARQKSGKTMLVDNVGLNVARLGVPVLNVDTEMSKEEHVNRILANLSGLKTREVERGKYGTDAAARRRLEGAAERLADLPYDYLSCMGQPFEDILAQMRRWVMRRVGLGPDGKARPCVIVYDWLKLASGTEVGRNLQEYQALGFITSGLKNFMGRYGVSNLTFAQLNRDGIDKDDTSVIRGSDRILDFITSFSIYRWKTDLELEGEVGMPSRYTHKLIVLLSRHGESMREGDYVNVRSEYEMGRVTEGPTRGGRAADDAKVKGDIVADFPVAAIEDAVTA